jgi:hypothetical protein
MPSKTASNPRGSTRVKSSRWYSIGLAPSSRISAAFSLCAVPQLEAGHPAEGEQRLADGAGGSLHRARAGLAARGPHDAEAGMRSSSSRSGWYAAARRFSSFRIRHRAPAAIKAREERPLTQLARATVFTVGKGRVAGQPPVARLEAPSSVSVFAIISKQLLVTLGFP